MGCDCHTLFGIFADGDPLSGNAGLAGWIGFLTNGGVLYWLLFRHLPDKDRQIERLISRADERADKQDAEHQQSLAMIMDRHDARNRELVEAMKEEFVRVVSYLHDRSQNP